MKEKLLAYSCIENEELVLLIKRYERILTPQNQVGQYLSSINLTLSSKSTIHKPLTFISNNNLTTQQKLSPQQNVFFGPRQQTRVTNIFYENSNLLVHPK